MGDTTPSFGEVLSSVHVYVYVYVFVYLYVCVYVHVHVYVRMCVCVCVCACITVMSKYAMREQFHHQTCEIDNKITDEICCE